MSDDPHSNGEPETRSATQSEAQQDTTLANKSVIITGSARRIGAVVAKRLHAAGASVTIHYGGSESEALTLVESLNQQRTNSAIAVQADLANTQAPERIVNTAINQWGRLDALINNASAFYPTPVGSITHQQVDDLFTSNYRAPLFLAQAAAPHLAAKQGVIINMVDVHAFRPYATHPVYCSAKAALLMLTKSLAMELAPDIRVNGIAPGSILWPEGDADIDEAAKSKILDGIALARNGTPGDIAEAIAFLVSPAANYITGHVLPVDGGRSI